jgi:hypothetical protein
MGRSLKETVEGEVRKPARAEGAASVDKGHVVILRIKKGHPRIDLFRSGFFLAKNRRIISRFDGVISCKTSVSSKIHRRNRKNVKGPDKVIRKPLLGPSSPTKSEKNQI